MKILVTCPPMLASRIDFVPALQARGIEVVCPDIVQTLTEQELTGLVPEVDGWIIGDDPATRRVLEAGVKGRLKAAVKWGVGTDNIDFQACQDLGIAITNTPAMFGAEVADIALGYIIALARQTFAIDRDIRLGYWPKPQGISLAGKWVGLVGYGDIGQSLHKRLLSLDTHVLIYDPQCQPEADLAVRRWPQQLGTLDFLVFTCALTRNNVHMLNVSTLAKCKQGVRIVNVARGKLIDEAALITALEQGHVHSAALDVFEQEPLPAESYLLRHPACILGSHNASNTCEAVVRTNQLAIDNLLAFLGCPR